MDNTKAFLRDYAALVRRYGLAWGYDTGYSTPEEVHELRLDDPAVTDWLEDLEEGNEAALLLCCLDTPAQDEVTIQEAFVEPSGLTVPKNRPERMPPELAGLDDKILYTGNTRVEFTPEGQGTWVMVYRNGHLRECYKDGK